MSPEASERRLAAILSADVVGYSRLMAEDEPGTIRTLNAYRDLIASLVGDHHGRVVDATGDNLLAEFPNALDAVQCAVEVQGVLRVRNQSLSESSRMLFRIGVHLGDITAEGDRLYGDGVNIAARLESLAESGGICISGEVHSQVRSRLGLDFEDLSELPVKNIPEPVHVYRVKVEAETPSARSSRGRMRTRVLVAGVVVLLGAGAVAAWRMLAPEPAGPTAVVDSAPIRSIAVLPLENISGDASQEYFADGMTDALIADLAKIGELRVISRTSILQYKGTRKTVPQIAQELGVGALVEGTVMRVGDRVRITAQLIDARRDEHLWAERYERDLSDILALQNQVARAIAAEIEVELTPGERDHLAEATVVDPRAFDAYLRGMHRLQSLTAPSVESGLVLFDEAIAVDPDFALAHALKAVAYCMLSFPLDAAPASELLPKARVAAQRALDLDPSLTEAHSAMGMVLSQYDWDWEGAERAFERALTLQPNNPWAQIQSGFNLLVLDRPEEAIRAGERAVRISPADLGPRFAFAGILYMAGDTERAIEEARRIRELEPSFMVSGMLSSFYLDAGRENEAANAMLESLASTPDVPEGVVASAQEAFRTAGPAGLWRFMIELISDARMTGYLDALDATRYFGALGDSDGWFEWAEIAYNERSPNIRYLRLLSPDFIRSDPRFDDLVQRIGLPGA